MQQTNTLLLFALYAAETQPAIVENVNDNLMFVGYCTPDCRAYNEPKWLIKRILTDADGQKIFTAEGSRAFNQKWTDRKNLLYAPTEGWAIKEKTVIEEEPQPTEPTQPTQPTEPTTNPEGNGE